MQQTELKAPTACLELNSQAWCSVHRHIVTLQRESRRWRTGNLAFYKWKSSLFSVCDWLQTQAMADQLARAEVSDSPLFVVGFWRSGTTFLHELIASDRQFCAPTTLQCMNPSTMLIGLNRFAQRSDRVRRPMDGMTIAADSPQEDEFAMLALGAPSAYRMLLAPTYAPEALRLLSPDAMSAEESLGVRSTLLDFLRRLSVLDNRPPVLKSPTHSFRILLLARLFPRSRFICMNREPLDCFASNVRLWQTLFERYALTTWTRAEIEAFVVGAYTRLAQELVAARAVLPANRLVEVSFDDLASAPESTIESTYRRLELTGIDSARARWSAHVDSVRGYRPERHSWPPSEARRITTLLGDAADIVRGR